MLSTLRSKTSRATVTRVVIAVIILAACLIVAGKSFLAFIAGPVRIESGMDYENLEGQYVSFDAKYVIDEFVRQSEQNTDTKVKKLKNIGYLLYFDEDGVFFGAELPASKESEMNGYIDTTWSWLTEEIQEVEGSRTLRGTWTALEGQRLKYFNETITEDLGEDYLQAAVPYYINTNAIGPNTISFTVMWAIVAGLSLLYLIYILVRQFTGSYDKKLKKYLSRHPEMSMETIEADFLQAQLVGKRIWVGARFTIYISGVYAEIVDHEDLVWAYYYRRTGRHSESTLRVFNTAKTMTAIAASQTEAEAILKIYADTLPKIVVGYDKDLEKCFNKDFQHFLDIRYNAVSQGAPVSQDEPVSPENGSEN
jgi:hypothetical protein